MRLINGVRRVDGPCLSNARRIDYGTLPMVLDMHHNGIPVDVGVLRSNGEYLAQQEEIVADDIGFLIGRRMNPLSNPECARLLYDDMGLRPAGGVRITPHGAPVVDADALSSMLVQDPVVGLITRGRELRKLRTTYCEPLIEHIGEDGRIHTTFKLTTARTGRFASERPNLQNIPVRTEEGRRIRSAFVAPPGCVLGSVDLSQIEMVWAAELSQDATMLEVFRRGEDLHVRTACHLFHLDHARLAPLWRAYKRWELEEGGSQYAEMREFELEKRLPAKTLGFAVLYGVTPEGLQLQILAAGGPLIPLEECAAYIEAWFEMFDGVRRWMEEQYRRAMRYGMTWTAFGRPRLIPEVYSALKRIRSQGLRQAGNTPIQGTAGDHLKIAMAHIWQLVQDYRMSWPDCVCGPLLQIHDELVFALSHDIAEQFLAEAVVEMTTCVRPMECAVKASAVMSADWGGLK